MARVDRRLELHELLCDLLGSRNVYFEPTISTRMRYPAIVYKRDEIYNRFANNGVYLQDTAYLVTLIDQDPDSSFVDAISQLPRCRYNRHYEADNLNHDVFVLYY